MEIHFYESIKVIPVDKRIYMDWKSIKDVWESLHNDRENFNMPEIHTIQMCMLSNTWILAGYRMFVHQDNGITYEITLKSQGGTGDRSVRTAQNVYAMWASNVFRE